MNKKLKNAILGGVLVPCMIFTAACNQTPPPDNTPKTDAEIYTVLRGHALAGKLDIDTTKTVASVIKSLTKSEMSVDTSNAGITDQAILDSITSGMPSGVEYYGEKTEYVYKTNNTGFLRSYDYNSETSEYDILDEQDLTKKDQNKYVNYLFDKGYEEGEYQDPDTKIASYVDDKYAKETYIIAKEDVFGEDSEISGLIEKVKEYDTLAKFQNSINDLAEDMLSGTMEGLEISADDATVSMDITVTDNKYTLVANVVIDDLSMVTPMGEAIVDVDADIVLNFTENGITGMSMGTDMDATISMPTAGLLPGVEGADKKIDIVSSMEMDASMELNATISDVDTTMNATYSDYEGTGEEGAIENREARVEIEFVGLDLYTHHIDVTSGDDFDHELEDVYIDEGVQIDGLYWDKACTQAVATTEKYPSYDCTIYAKVSLKQGYAQVTTTFKLGTMSFTDSEIVLVADCPTYSISAENNGAILSTVTVDNETKTLKQDGSFDLTLESGHIYDVVATYVAPAQA